MDETNTFKTKTGYCHVLPDKIVLTRDGLIGTVSATAVGNHISRILIIYGVMVLVLSYSAFQSYQQGHTVQSVILALLAIYLIYGIFISINNSATPVIERKSIRKIQFKKAIPGLTRSRFEVLFENESGKLKKRLILLPGSLTGGPDETEKAISILKSESLL